MRRNFARPVGARNAQICWCPEETKWRVVAGAGLTGESDLSKLFRDKVCKIARCVGAIPFNQQIGEKVAIGTGKFFGDVHHAFYNRATRIRVLKGGDARRDFRDQRVIFRAACDHAKFFAALYVDADGTGIIIMRYRKKSSAQIIAIGHASPHRASQWTNTATQCFWN